MIRKHSFSTVYVLDQERAKQFYTEKLGLELRDDQRMGSFRWITVGPKAQPDAAIVLMPIAEGPTMDKESVELMKKLVQKGALGGGVFDTDDCKRTYEELKARGVTFVREPKEMPYGVEALLRDDSGNFFSLTQRFDRR
jgi:predicted enzyme related to lactoylglutathione lyase